MIRLRSTIPLLVVGMFWSGLLMGDDKKTEKDPIIISKRLPANYSKLGLSQKQKNDIYRVRAKYETEIQELQQKINELRDQQKIAFERVLTPSQKARLREILVGSDKAKAGDDEDAPVKTTKRKGTEAKGKKGPVEIKK